MIYLDTNVLIRIITGDVPTVANKILAQIDASAKGTYFIHDAVFVELCFVLEFHDYAMPRHAIAEALVTLQASPQVVISNESMHALQLYKKYPKLDYADCLLFVLGGEVGVLTLDKEFIKTLLKS